jgi:hypothetical protein
MFLTKLVLPMVLSGIMAFADTVPTIHQVYQAAESGDLNSAHQMVEQVLKAHPESAKAHYVDAEILVRQGNLSEAKNELTNAEKLSPGLPFAKPQSVQSLKQHLGLISSNSSVNNSVNELQPKKQSISWTMILLGAAALAFIWLAIRSFASRNSNSYPAQYNGGNATSGVYPSPNAPNNPYGQNPGYGAGQPYPQQSGGLGGGMMSGLATGAAAGVGIVAGEALMHHFMDGSSESNNGMNHSSDNQSYQQSNNDMGGGDFGMNDSSSWDSGSSDDMSSDDNW